VEYLQFLGHSIVEKNLMNCFLVQHVDPCRQSGDREASKARRAESFNPSMAAFEVNINLASMIAGIYFNNITYDMVHANVVDLTISLVAYNIIIGRFWQLRNTRLVLT